ncbi:MAG TPA: dTDP-4-amino-4,6-dideoxygalactose transaminase [Anaerolineales bacterium]|nr:dTDP-4-amino-4,6-dideoxygalactose transaminase [Anaerolineales bacterium]
MKKISFNQPIISGNEFTYMQDAIKNMHISGDGVYTRKCHALLEETLGVKKVLLTTSCTHALELSALLLNIQPGDEVIIPSFTFVSTVNAFVLRGAIPVFIDIRPDTLNMDEKLLRSRITTKTKAIVPVHYAGVGCEMDKILDIANQFNIAVVEDNAHGLFGKYKGKFLGTFGRLAAQSFHETKNFSCGEGGAILINDESLVERAEIIREKGTNRSRFFRGQVDKYTWVDMGSSYLPSDLLAAWLFAQLENRNAIQNKRQKIWEYYQTHLQDWARSNNIQLPKVPEYVEQSFHMFYLLLSSFEDRQGLIQYLRERNIESVFHYLPLHLSDMGKRFGGKSGDCPVTERISDQLVRLPFSNALSEEDQSVVVKTLLDFRTGKP